MISVFDWLRFQNILISVQSRRFLKFLRFEERFRKLRFRDGQVWMVGLTVEIKLRFRDG